MVKKLMRPRARSISVAHPTVHGTASGLEALSLLGWTAEKAAHCLCLDDSSRDDSVPHTRGAHAVGSLRQRVSAVTVLRLYWVSVSVAPSSRSWRRPQRPGPQLPLVSHWPTLPHTVRPIVARSLHVLLGDSAVIRRASTPSLALAASARACGRSRP